ncbi:MAG: hypothetical protein LUP91_04835 [Methylococcaceae bacterium]|nr:hypothetical protein [Methylococcaceae bacterium]
MEIEIATVKKHYPDALYLGIFAIYSISRLNQQSQLHHISLHLSFTKKEKSKFDLISNKFQLRQIIKSMDGVFSTQIQQHKKTHCSGRNEFRL